MTADARPLAVDLFCGRGGWGAGFLAAGYRVVGVDVEPQPDYPGEFMQADIRKLDGHQFRGARVVVASPPCEGFSLAAARWHRPRPNPLDFELVLQALRVIGEAEPRWWAIENVRGALQHFPKLGIGEPRYHSMPWYLWGHFPGFIRDTSRPLYKLNAGRYGGKAAADAAIIPPEIARPFAEACLS